MNKDWSFYDAQTGLFDRGVLSTADPATVAANTPPGHVAIEGRFDPLSQRVDVAAGEVVDWHPPAPPDDEFTTHRWQADIKRWVRTPTVAAVERERQARVKAEMAAIEAQQARPTRELILDADNRQARVRLHALDRQLANLRAELASPPSKPPA